VLIKHGSFPVILTRYTNLVSEKTLFVPLMAFRIPRYVCHVFKFGFELVVRLSFDDPHTRIGECIATISVDRLCICVCLKLSEIEMWLLLK